MTTSAAIRKQFLDFFASRGHTIVPSAPIVIKNDPSLLFTNAGMNQFKDYFLGNKKPPHSRVADTQKCLRVSGKQNDLEEVGVDTYHHTMFEMLGNWSFGDYFKKEAIEWSWQLLTETFALDKDRLYVTIFEGDGKEGIEKDIEAFNEWKRWIPEERILMGNKKDNFWEMGDTGPCGPCSEIHFDGRPEEERQQIDGKSLVNADNPQVIEIWNNVFIQFNRLKDGSLALLPAKHVDTGMGFERLVRILQNKKSNYDTDIFTGTIAQIGQITGRSYGNTSDNADVAFRVLADHVRAIGFCIADGQLPSNTGAGYVIRRILRRGVRYAYSFLGYDKPLLFQLIPTIAKQFDEVFPELQQQVDFVTRVVREEEEGFLKTLEKGIQNFNEHIRAGSSENTTKVFDGNSAFLLFDTYGFPIDLTQLMARELGWTVDMETFNVELQKQKTRSRAATAIEAEDWNIVSDKSSIGFVGYDTLETNTPILKYRKVKTKGREIYQLVLEKTPFYAESGGQVGDTGQLVSSTGVIEIIDTKRENDLVVHLTGSLPENLTGTFVAKVNSSARKETSIHHTATHLLHAALREVLGNHVAQKGSLVNGEHLRFDFSHFAKLSTEEMGEVEHIVNRKIRENIPVVTKEMTRDEAMQMGATALFGEKYGSRVRVVIIDPAYSIELCGGTHVGATGELGFFKIEQEAAVAAGVRRIEAISGSAAENYINNQFATIASIKDVLKNPKTVETAVNSLIDENGDLKKRIEHLESRQLVVIRNELLAKDEIINQLNFVGSVVEVSTSDALKRLATDLKNHLRDCVIVLGANIGGKPFAVVSIADNVVAARGLDAAAMIKQHIAPLIKGGGGGQKNLASAGGQEPAGLIPAIDLIKTLL